MHELCFSHITAFLGASELQIPMHRSCPLVVSISSTARWVDLEGSEAPQDRFAFLGRPEEPPESPSPRLTTRATLSVARQATSLPRPQSDPKPRAEASALQSELTREAPRTCERFRAVGVKSRTTATSGGPRDCFRELGHGFFMLFPRSYGVGDALKWD